MLVATTVLAVFEAAFLLWAGLGIWHGTAPTWVFVMLVIVAVVFGGEETQRRGRRSSGPTRGAMSLVRGVWVMAAALAIFSALAIIGTNYFQTSVLHRTVQVPQLTQPTPSAAVVNVPQAKLALKSSAPNAFATLANPDNPRTSIVGDNVSYEWEYLVKQGAAAVQVKRVKITLDAAGRVVAISGS